MSKFNTIASAVVSLALMAEGVANASPILPTPEPSPVVPFVIGAAALATLVFIKSKRTAAVKSSN